MDRLGWVILFIALTAVNTVAHLVGFSMWLKTVDVGPAPAAQFIIVLSWIFIELGMGYILFLSPDEKSND